MYDSIYATNEKEKKENRSEGAKIFLIDNFSVTYNGVYVHLRDVDVKESGSVSFENVRVWEMIVFAPFAASSFDIDSEKTSLEAVIGISEVYHVWMRVM